MLKKILILALLVVATSFVSAQSHEPFTGADARLDSPQVQKWIKAGGQFNTQSSIKRTGGAGLPSYTNDSLGFTAYAMWDSATGTDAEASFTLTQESGNTNTKEILLFRDDNSTFATGGGMVCMYVPQSGAADDQLLMRFYSINYGVAGTTRGFPHMANAIAAPIGPLILTSEVAVGDTVYLRFWGDAPARYTCGVRHVGGGHDSLTVLVTDFTGSTLSTLNVSLTSTGRFGIGGYVRSTPNKFDNFRINTPGAAAPPPDTSTTDTARPIAGTLTPSSATVTVGTSVYATFSATDDSALANLSVKADTGTGYYAVDNTNASGVQKTMTWNTSQTIRRWTAGTATLIAYVSDAAGKLDTSLTATVTFNATTTDTLGDYKKKLYGYITFPGDINLSANYPGVGSLGGRMPSDSLPWSVLTHVSFFAADCNSDGSWNDGGNGPGYRLKMPLIAEQAHLRGVYAGFCFGGSGDAGIRAAITNPAAHTTLINMLLDLIDNKGQDFIDFDLEGTIDGGAWTTFAARFYDSLQTRQSHNNSLIPPFIVLTVGTSRASSTAWVASKSYVKIVDLMSYDQAGSWWGQINHDCSVTSWSNLNGTGTNLDPQNYAGQGGKAFPSMQEAARLVVGAGWDANQVIAGADFNPTTITGGAFADGRGPTTIRKVWTSQPSWSGSGLKFQSQWNASNILSGVPYDSIRFDPISNTYWAHTGTTAATDKMILQVSWPGRDSSIMMMRRMTDSMNVGGIMIWGLTETYGTTTPPAQGWGWLSRQFEKHFAGTMIIDSTLNPPVNLTPSNGATNQSLTPPFNWEDIAGAAATAGYQIRISASSSMSSPLKDTTVTPSSMTLAAGYLSYNTPYYWQVRVKNTDGAWGQYSAVTSLTTIAVVPGTPTITYPTASQVLIGSSTSTQWTAASNGPTTYVAGSSFYGVQVSTDPTFSTIFKSDSGGSTTLTRSYTVTGMANSTSYSVRVRARTAGGYGAWSSVVTFSTGSAPPGQVILSQPANGTGGIVGPAVLMTWGATANALTYFFQFDTVATFAAPLVSLNVGNVLAYQYPSAVDGERYYWRVYAVGQTANGPYSETYSFTVRDQGPPPPPSANEQMGYWFDIITGNWVWNRPAVWLMYMRSLPDMSDVPWPVDTTKIAWSPWGIKFHTGGVDTTLFYSFGDATTGASSGMIDDIIDSLMNRNLYGLHLINPIIYGVTTYRWEMDTSSLPGTYEQTRVVPAHVSQSPDIILSSLNGQMALRDNNEEVLNIGGATLGTPLGGASGGTGHDVNDGLSGFLRFNSNKTLTVGHPDTLIQGGSYGGDGTKVFAMGSTNAKFKTYTFTYATADSISRNVWVLPRERNKTVYANVYVTATNPDGTSGGAYFIEAAVKFNSTGQASLLSTAISSAVIGETVPGYDAWGTISSNIVYIGVKGAPAVNLTWSIVAQYVVAD